MSNKEGDRQSIFIFMPWCYTGIVSLTLAVDGFEMAGT